MTDEDVERLLALRIRRISAFDLEKNRDEIATGDARLEEVRVQLGDMTATTIAYVEGLIERFGASYPRRTRCADLEVIAKDSVAQPTIKLAYDQDTGFFGSNVKGTGREFRVTEYDLILAITDDGVYRILSPPEKILLEGRVKYLEIFDRDKGADFTVIYRDADGFAYGKRIHIEKFIRNREYQLIKDKAGKLDLLLDGDAKGTLTLDFVRTPRQRVGTGRFDLAKLEVMGATARGLRLARKAVRKLKWTPPAKKTAKKTGSKAKPATRQASLF
jgi:topoisomerase-4 subunit A